MDTLVRENAEPKNSWEKKIHQILFPRKRSNLRMIRVGKRRNEKHWLNTDQSTENIFYEIIEHLINLKKEVVVKEHKAYRKPS